MQYSMWPMRHDCGGVQTEIPDNMKWPDMNTGIVKCEREIGIHITTTYISYHDDT